MRAEADGAAQERLALEEKLAQAERDALLTLGRREQVHREQLESQRREKVLCWTRVETGALASSLTTAACACVCVCAEQEQQRAELSVQRQQAEEQLRRQREELRASNQHELQQVQEELARLQQDSKLKLLQAESEKQQVCDACSCRPFNVLLEWFSTGGVSGPTFFSLY